MNQSDSNQPISLLSISFFYLGIATLGVGLLRILEIPIIDFFRAAPPIYSYWKIAAIGCLAGSMVVVLTSLIHSWTDSRQLANQHAQQLIGHLSKPSLVIIAVLSSFAEEIFFRGFLLESIGLFWSSLVFCLLHSGPDPLANQFKLSALATGLLFGWTVVETGSLWPAMIGHSIVNFATLVLVPLKSGNKEHKEQAVPRVESPENKRKDKRRNETT